MGGSIGDRVMVSVLVSIICICCGIVWVLINGIVMIIVLMCSMVYRMVLIMLKVCRLLVVI